LTQFLRKNKPEATIEQPSGGAGVMAVSSNQTKRTKTSWWTCDARVWRLCACVFFEYKWYSHF